GSLCPVRFRIVVPGEAMRRAWIELHVQALAELEHLRPQMLAGPGGDARVLRAEVADDRTAQILQQSYVSDASVEDRAGSNVLGEEASRPERKTPAHAEAGH